MLNNAENSSTRNVGIEAWFGGQNKAAVTEFLERKIEVIPEDSKKSVAAKEIGVFIGQDPTMRLKSGSIWAQFILPTSGSDLPSGTLVERWSVYDSAFGFKRALDEHIAGAYLPGGEQYQNRTEAVKLVNALLSRMQSDEITEDQMIELHDEAFQILFDVNYINSTHPDRVSFGQQVLRATEPKADNNLNRPNRRVILAAQRPLIIMDRALEQVIALKNLDRANEVDAECDFEELSLKAVLGKMKTLDSIKIGTGGFDEKAWKNFKYDAFHLLSPKTTILMSPYSSLAAKLRYGIFATNFENDVITLGKYMPLKNAIEFTDSMPILDEPNLGTRKRRIGQLLQIGSEGLNNLIEERYEGSKPKKPKQNRKNKIDQFWDEVDAKLKPMDEGVSKEV